MRTRGSIGRGLRSGSIVGSAGEDRLMCSLRRSTTDAWGWSRLQDRPAGSASRLRRSERRLMQAPPLAAAPGAESEHLIMASCARAICVSDARGTGARQSMLLEYHLTPDAGAFLGPAAPGSL